VIRGRVAPVASLLAKLPPGLELAVHFALQVRGICAVGDGSFMGTRAALHEALHSPTLDQADKLGDALIDVALYCARLLEQQSATFIQSVSYAQKAVMLLQSQATGLAQDDARLAALMRSLCGRSWYPAQYSKAAWPAKPVEVALSNRRRAVAILDQDVSAPRAERHLDDVCESIDPREHQLTRIRRIKDLFCRHGEPLI